MRAVLKTLFLLTVIVCLSPASFAQETDEADESAKTPAVKKTPEGPKPDYLVKYGTHERQVFDFWRPRSQKPTPLVVYIHGGSLSSGSKEKISLNQVKKMLESGFAVMSVNYRLTPEAVYPQHYMDCVRAIQFARHNAKELNIDPKKIAAMGNSAGGLAALWIAFHDDFADPKNADPVLRQSSRVVAVAAFSAQTTVEPDVVKAKVGEAALGHSYFKGRFLGLSSKDLGTPRAAELFKAASPTTYLSKDDPPVWMLYTVAKAPLKAESTYSDGIHHISFGYLLREQMMKLNVESTVLHKDEVRSIITEMIAFFKKHFR